MGIIRNYEENGIPQNNRLKYSDSTLGQGPIIQKSIPDDLGDPVFSKNELNSRTDDLLRITTLLTRNQGQKFILNNAALNQLENAQKIGKAVTGNNENNKGAIGRTIGTLGQVGRGIIKQAADTTNLIASTLAQVPVNGTGTHFVHKFRTDTYLNPGGELFGSFLGIDGGYQSSKETLFGKNLPSVLEGITGDGEPEGYVQSRLIEKSSPGESKLRDLKSQPLIGFINTLPYGPPPAKDQNPTKPRNTTYLKTTEGKNFSMQTNGWKNLAETGSLEGRTGEALGKVTSELKKQSKTGATEVISPYSGSSGNNPVNKAYLTEPGPGIFSRLNLPVIGEKARKREGVESKEEQTKGTVQELFEDSLTKSKFVSETSDPTPTNRNPEKATKSLKTGLSILTNTSKPRRVNLYRDENDDRRMSSRVRIGDPGKHSYSINDEYDNYDKDIVEGSIDKINELGPQNGIVGLDKGRDLIKFRFNIITPDSSKLLYFRAFLDSFDDSFSGNWNSFNYVGRGEQFHTYNTFDRSISLSFKIAAQTRYEMKPIYQKMVTLASATAPTYNKEGFMRGTFAELTVGSYLHQTPGIIESVQYSWQTDYPWEIAMNEPEQRTGNIGGDRYQQELPMIMNATVQFKPIHRFLPETGLKHYITNPQAPNKAKFFYESGNPGPVEKLRS